MSITKLPKQAKKASFEPWLGVSIGTLLECVNGGKSAGANDLLILLLPTSLIPILGAVPAGRKSIGIKK